MVERAVDEARFDPRDPAVVAPLVAYLISADCPLSGQVLSIRGDTVVVNHGWTAGARVNSDGGWTVPALATALGTIELEDPFDRLATALGGALGEAGRAQLEAMIAAELDRPA
jgi:hypothetical protein